MHGQRHLQFSIAAPGLFLTGDERAYVEFTLFSALRPHADRVSLVRCGLRARRTSGGAQVIVCAVRVDSAAGVLAARGSSDRLYHAVELAARRLALSADAALGGSRSSGARPGAA